ncbi:MAG TPA: division/cell wall cluster transcriptional repressor MraZ [Symbiobacteriaceae bacterium]|nr:division/cell wall cluster transcriptional repressor MraZ [Symbiobacteriaceae bacterium]
MFMGEFQHTVDAKGRLIIPAKFRDGLGERFIATRGLENCLFVFSEKEWALFGDKLKQLPLASGAARQFNRLLFSGATECELDPQGRINLPANLREYAAIEKEAVVVGVSSRVEIWAKDRWAEYCKKAEESFADTAEKLLDI